MEIFIAAISIIITSCFWLFYFKNKMKDTFLKGKQKGTDEFLSLLLDNGYQSKVKTFNELNKHCLKGGTVFVGDSITQDYNVYEFFHDLCVYNRGIGGDTTVGLMKRLEASVYALEPARVVLMIGTNDFALLDTNSHEVFLNIKKIINEIKSKLPNVEIILESIYPVSKALDPKIKMISVGKRDNILIDQTNEMLKTIEGVTFVDLNSILKDVDGNLILEYTVEGLHINELGYQKITSVLRKYF